MRNRSHVMTAHVTDTMATVLLAMSRLQHQFAGRQIVTKAYGACSAIIHAQQTARAVYVFAILGFVNLVIRHGTVQHAINDVSTVKMTFVSSLTGTVSGAAKMAFIPINVTYRVCMTGVKTVRGTTARV